MRKNTSFNCVARSGIIITFNPIQNGLFWLLLPVTGGNNVLVISILLKQWRNLMPSLHHIVQLSGKIQIPLKVAVRRKKNTQKIKVSNDMKKLAKILMNSDVMMTSFIT